MHRIIHFGLTKLPLLAIILVSARTSDAELRHRYSFNSDISDSVGTADGTLIDPTGTVGNFTGGRLDLTAIDDVISSDQDPFASGAYVDLPNGIVSDLGDVATFETWVNVETNRTWSQIFSFGSSNEGEDISTGGAGSKYVTLIPQSEPERLEVHITEVGVDGGNPIREGGPLEAGVDHHLVTVINGADTMGGANPDGTAYLYLNGNEVARAGLYPGFTLSGLPDVNNWLGRSQWPDALFDGSYDEFRMYNHALTEADAALHSLLGPDQLAPENGAVSLEVNTVTGNVKLVSNVDVDVPFNYYEITSAGGALEKSGWNSLDDQEAGDSPGDGWDESGGANSNQLIELFLLEEGDMLSAGAELNLGNAFNTGIFGNGNDGDLQFQVGWTGASGLLVGNVNYVDMAVDLTGDYNNDGVVNAADYVVWRDNLGADSTLSNDNIGGTVGQAHYEQWMSNYGAAFGASAAAVPEPTAILSLTMASAVGVLFVRSQRPNP